MQGPVRRRIQFSIRHGYGVGNLVMISLFYVGCRLRVVLDFPKQEILKAAGSRKWAANSSVRLEKSKAGSFVLRSIPEIWAEFSAIKNKRQAIACRLF